MYASEYGFAALPEFWIKELYNYEKSEGYDWMLTNETYEWTISRYSSDTDRSLNVNNLGNVHYYDYYVNTERPTRPTFVLSSDVKITNAEAGVGSINNPMIIN